MINKLNDNNSVRERWPDILRIIACFSVIVLHASGEGFNNHFGSRTIEWQVCNIYNSVVRFCVPIFVMLSGMFMLNPEREYNIKKIYRVKICKIVIAYLFWAILYTLVFLLEAISKGTKANVYGWLFAIARGILNGHYHLWFLFMICGLYIIVPFLRMIVKNEKIMLYFLLLSFVFVFCVNMIKLNPLLNEIISLPIRRLDISMVSGYSGYYILGYYLSRKKLSIKKRYYVYLGGIMGVIATIVINGYLGYRLEVRGQWMFNYLLPNILLMSISIFVFFKYHSPWQTCSKMYINGVISLLSRCSFGIYLVHAFFLERMECLGLPHFFLPPIISIPITAAVVFMLSFATTYLLSRIPFISKYVL